MRSRTEAIGDNPIWSVHFPSTARLTTTRSIIDNIAMGEGSGNQEVDKQIADTNVATRRVALVTGGTLLGLGAISAVVNWFRGHQKPAVETPAATKATQVDLPTEDQILKSHGIDLKDTSKFTSPVPTAQPTPQSGANFLSSQKANR